MACTFELLLEKRPENLQFFNEPPANIAGERNGVNGASRGRSPKMSVPSHEASTPFPFLNIFGNTGNKFSVKKISDCLKSLGSPRSRCNDDAHSWRNMRRSCNEEIGGPRGFPKNRKHPLCQSWFH